MKTEKTSISLYCQTTEKAMQPTKNKKVLPDLMKERNNK